MRAKDTFLLQVKATSALLAAHKEKFPRRPSLDPASSHILRAVIVFLIAAVDAYIHKRIVEVVKRRLRYQRTISPSAVKKIASELGGQDSIVNFVNLMLKEKYYEELSKILEEKISDETFQKSKKLQEAFEIMGMDNGWEKVTEHFYATNRRRGHGPRPKLDLVLDELADRRDIIVHQGDMHFSKKYDGEFRSISRSKLQKDFQTLFKLLLSIEAITEKL